MSDIIALLKDFLPIEIALIFAIFIYLLLLFKRIAEKFIELSEKQTSFAEKQAEYIQQRLDVVEKTLGISDKAFDLQEKQIKKLEEISKQQETEVARYQQLNNATSEQLRRTQQQYDEAVQAFNLKEQEAKSLQDALNRVEQASRIDAVAAVTHEWAVFVQSILAQAENLTRAENQKDRENILNGLINTSQLLGLRLQNVRASYEVEEASRTFRKLDLAELAKEAIAIYSRQANFFKAKILFRVAPAKESFVITGNKSNLLLAISNLIENALKYSTKDSENHMRDIVVNLEKSNGTVKLTVTNLGIGIEADEKDKIFMQGYRTSKAMKFSPIGSGTALYVAKQIIVAHDGDIQVQSEPVSETGTHRVSFTMKLPDKEKS